MEDQTKIEDVLRELDQSCFLCHNHNHNHNHNHPSGKLETMCSEHLLRIQKIYVHNGHTYLEIEAEIKKRNLHVE